MLSYLKEFESYILLEQVSPKVHVYIQTAIDQTIIYFQQQIQKCEIDAQHSLLIIRALPKLEQDFTPYTDILIRMFEHCNQLYTWKDRLPRSQYINRGAIY
jgi:hypothetical protein